MIDKIKKILAEKQPMKARDIARELRADRTDVNRVLHAHKLDFVPNDQHEWSLRVNSLVVQFPQVNWLTAGEFERALDAVQSPLESEHRVVIFRFGPDTSVLLEAAARLLSLCNQLVDANKHVSLEFPKARSKASGYLNRLGFYRLLHKDVKVLPQRPELSSLEAREGTNSAVVEVKHIDLANRDESIPHQLRNRVDQHVPDATQVVHTIVTELFSNIYEHSSSPIPAFAALQLYRNSNVPHVSTVFSDSGAGIVGSLFHTLPAAEKQALEQSGKDVRIALIERVFSRGHLSRKQEDGHGLGLYATGNAVRKFVDGTVIVRQDSFEVTLVFQDGEPKFSHRLGLKKLCGTQICIKFNLTRRL